MTSLKDFGWNDFHQNNYNQSTNHGDPAARVVSVQGFKHHLVTEKGEIEAELAGRLLYGTEAEDLPKVGDWVCYLDYGQSGYIIERLPRQNMLSRKMAGKKNERQVLGANIDYAIIVQGLDRDFNVMRLDRYITQIVACGIQPIVVLNKIDLVPDPDAFLQLVKDLKRDVEISCCSTVSGRGIADLRALRKDHTYILIGSSGVGKSSLLNALMNAETQQTSEVSDFNGRGRHTTTARELFMLPNGSLLMDTPGMREFGVTSEDGVDGDSLFPAIKAIAVNCKYSDCSHMSDEGCAVIAALGTGELDPAIYESFVKLVKEQRRFGIRAEEKKRVNKVFGRIVKEAKSFRKRYKY
ncbi:MAG TPA: ribosome small subunit-dependent GTPase A [Cyclobacteriaceae bacterium]